LVVPGRPGTGELLWWIYSTQGVRPVATRLKLTAGPKEAAGGAHDIPANKIIHGLGRPGDDAITQNVFVVATTGLNPDLQYSLTLLDDGSTVSSRTLPSAPDLKPITIGVGSCYGRSQGKQVDAWSRLNAIFNGPNNPLRFRILCGDQLYLDLDPRDDGTITRSAPPVWERYLDQWHYQPFADFLTASPNLVMADDHEFWNNYPVRNRAWNWWADRELGQPTGLRFDRAYSVFQASLNLDPGVLLDDSSQANRDAVDKLLRDHARTFELDLGFFRIFMLDTRTRRTSVGYNQGKPSLAVPNFAEMPAVNWLENTTRAVRALTVPGVLILSQPLVEEPNASAPWEENLPEYADDYARLWQAVCAAQAHVLVVSGDIHWSRLYSITPAERPQDDVYEFISSPLSRIRSLWGTADPKLPERREGSVRWESESARGQARWNRWPPGYVTDDRNVYATLTFTPQATGGSVAVDAWLWPLSEPSLRPVRYDRFILKSTA